MFRVCFATEDFYPSFIGGQGVYGKELVENLARRNIEVTVLAEKRPNRKKFWLKRKNIHLSLVPFCSGQQLILAFLEYYFFLLRYRKQYFDILHANQLSGFFFLLKRPKNIGKIIITAHNTYYEMFHESSSMVKRLKYLPFIFLEKIVYRRADAVSFHNFGEKKKLITCFHLKNQSYAVVPPGVNHPKYTLLDRIMSRKKIIKKFRLKTNTKIILYVGRLVKRKKIETIINTIKLLNHQKENVSAIIIGKGPEEETLKKIATPNVIFPGFVADTRDFFLAADVFMTLSVAEGGVSLSVCEAASYGLPLLISPSCACIPILRNGINGFVASSDNAWTAAQKLKEIFEKSNKMEKESIRLAANFSWEKCAEDTISFYRKISGKVSGN